MKGTLTATLCAALALIVPAEACEIRGTWKIQLVRVSSDEQGGFGPFTDRVVCWFEISRLRASIGDVHIVCPPGEFFSLDQDDFPGVEPEWRIVKQPSVRSITVEGERVRTPNLCLGLLIEEGALHDEEVLHGATYTINFSGRPTTVLSGEGEGFLDYHFGSTEPFHVTFTGIRQ